MSERDENGNIKGRTFEYDPKRCGWTEMVSNLAGLRDEIKLRQKVLYEMGVTDEPSERHLEQIDALDTAWKLITAIEPFRDELKTRIQRGDYRNRS